MVIDVEYKIDKEVRDIYEMHSPMTYSTEDAGAFDLRSSSSVVLWPSDKKLIDTGLKLAIPPGFAGMLLTRSGNGIKRDITLANSVGLIDADYRGSIVVALKNTGISGFKVARGDRIAQMIIVPVVRANPVIVDEFSRKTGRGEGGLGHTGVT